MGEDRLQELSAGFILGNLQKREQTELRKLLRHASAADKEDAAAVINAGALASLAIPPSAPSPRAALKTHDLGRERSQAGRNSLRLRRAEICAPRAGFWLASAPHAGSIFNLNPAVESA